MKKKNVLIEEDKLDKRPHVVDIHFGCNNMNDTD
jgi:hypothetical protein